MIAETFGYAGENGAIRAKKLRANKILRENRRDFPHKPGI
jgi:hypothetical protein